MSHHPVHYSVVVDTAAQLAGLNANFNAGDTALVANAGQWKFRYDPTSAAALNDPTVISGPGGVGRWLRMPEPNQTISTAAVYYIALTGSGGTPVGNDANDGLSQATALATFAEFVRRYGSSPIVEAAITVRFLDTSVAEDIIFAPEITSTGTVAILGSRTQVGAGTLTAAPTPRNSATNTPLEITDAARPNWTSVLGNTILMITTLASPAYGSTAWPVKATDIVNGKCRLTTMSNFLPAQFGAQTVVETTPQNGDAYVLYTFTNFTGLINIDCRGPYANGMFFGEAQVSNPLGNVTFFYGTGLSQEVGNLVIDGSASFGNVMLSNTMGTVNQVFTFLSGQQTLQLGGSLSEVDTYYSFLLLYLGYLIQGASLVAYSSEAVLDLNDVMIFDAPQLVWIDNGAVCNVLQKVSGVPSAGGVVFRNRCGTVNKFVTAPATWQASVYARGNGAPDFLLGRTDNAQGAAYLAGAPSTLSAERAYTFVNLDTAAAGGGFGGGTARLDGYAVMNG